MHRYEQSTGRWILPSGRELEVGYSGYDPDPTRTGEPGEGKNRPELEGVRNVGPIPAGRYAITAQFTHRTAGEVVMRLLPVDRSQAHGRDGFLVHGDSRLKPGTASHGCIVLSRAARLAIAKSNDRDLEVVPGAPAAAKEIA